jgi:hypothetical protein
LGARLEAQQLLHDALVRAEADGVAEESGDGAEFAPVGAAAAGLDGDDMERLPLLLVMRHEGAHQAGNAVELVEVEGFPGDLGVVLEGGFAVLAEGVHREITFL